MLKKKKILKKMTNLYALFILEKFLGMKKMGKKFYEDM